MKTTRPDAQQVITILCSIAADGSVSREDSTLGSDSTLESDFGIGSLERVELRMRLETTFGVVLGDEAFMQSRTVGDLVALLGREPLTASVAVAPAAPLVAGMHEAREARSLDEILVVQAAKMPDATAVTFLKEGQVKQSLTYSELLLAARRMAGGLAARGVQPGERVGLMLPTGLPFVAGFFGTLMCGAVPVPLYPPVRPDQILAFVRRQAAILANAKVRLLLSFQQVRSVDTWLRAKAGTLEEIVSADELLLSDPLPQSVEPQSDHPAFIQYTSGSTGVPRGVVLTHANLFANLEAFGECLPVRPTDVVVSWLPLYHDMGLIGMMLGSLYYGIPLVLMGPEDFLMRPSRWLRALSDYRGSISAAPNFAFEICARKVPDTELASLDLSAWRVAINGAEPVRPETLERFLERFEPYGVKASAMRPAYGLAEATLAVSMGLPLAKPRIDRVSRESLDREGWASPISGQELEAPFVSCGRPVLGIEVRIVDDKGRPVKERWQGRLQFRGPSAFAGYHENPEASGEVVVGDGWIDSGDLAYIADGEIFPTGRRKALILKGGRNIHAEDVERAVWPVAGVRNGCVAAFGGTDVQEGTEKLVVVAETRLFGAQDQRRMTEEIRQRVSDSVGLPPDEVRLVPPGSVPKTPSGKIRRSACRDAWLDGSLGKRVGLAGQLLRLMSESPAYWGQMMRRGLYAAWAAVCMLVFALVMLSSTLMGITPVVAGAFSRALLAVLGFSLSVQGPRPTRGPLLLVPNHCSAMDPIVLMAACPGAVRFVAAAWIADLPLVQPVLKSLRGVRIVRGGGDQANQEVAQMAAALTEGARLVAFAEGGLEVAPGLHPFMRGPFIAAARHQVAVVPVSVAGTRRGLRWGDRIPRPGELRVTFGEPVVPRGQSWDEVAALSNAVRAMVAQHCGEPMVSRRLVRED